MTLFSYSGKYCAEPKPEKKQAPPARKPQNRPAAPAPIPQNRQAAPAPKPEIRQAAPAPKPEAAVHTAPSRNKQKFPWVAFLCVLMVSVIALGAIALFAHYNRILDGKEIAATEPTVVQTEPATEAPATEPTEPPTEATEPEETDPPQTEPPVMLPDYMELYQRNPEMFGWLRIDNTRIDYPVMQSNDVNDEYLYANFDGEYSYAGTPFADIQCSRDSDNIIIYGHNMNDGSMFHHLLRYERESFWEENPTFKFSDLYGEYEYEVLAAFRDRIYKKTDTCFKFYQFMNAADEAEFDYAVSQFKEKAIYDTGVDAEYGDKLITLITCAYHVDNGRFVVVARRK